MEPELVEPVALEVCPSMRCNTWMDVDNDNDPSMRSVVVRSPDETVAGLSTGAATTDFLVFARWAITTAPAVMTAATTSRAKILATMRRVFVRRDGEYGDFVMISSVRSQRVGWREARGA